MSKPRALDDFAAEHTDFAHLLETLGYFPGRSKTVEKLMEQLDRSVKCFILDYDAFRRSVSEAVQQLHSFDGSCDPANQALLMSVAQAVEKRETVLNLLNRDPLNRSLPFVERVPVKRQNEVAWVAPIENALVVKRPEDEAQFSATLLTLEQLFTPSHFPHSDAARSKVLDGIFRVRRELKRDRPYLPPTLKSLETHIAAYLSAALSPDAQNAIDKLNAIIEGLERVRTGDVTQRSDIGKCAELYLNDGRLSCRSLLGELLQGLLHPRLLDSTGWRHWRQRKTVALIRSEIATGYYDANELIRRLRHVEQTGLYFSSLIYALLSQRAKFPARRSAATPKHEPLPKIARIRGEF